MPPLKITALPVFNVRQAASTVTFGRASKIIPITPIGTRFFPIVRPLGRFVIPKTSPIGSFSKATCKTPSAMPFMRSFVKRRRSIIEVLILFSFAFFKSISFSANILSVFSISAFAISFNASFFFSQDRFPIFRLADFAFFAISSTVILFFRLSYKCSDFFAVNGIVNHFRFFAVHNNC